MSNTCVLCFVHAFDILAQSNIITHAASIMHGSV